MQEGLALASDIQRVQRGADDQCRRYIRPLWLACSEIKAAVSMFCAVELVVHESRRSNGDAYNLARGSIYSSPGRHVWFLNPLV
jgi:hypothetical protein